MRCRTPRWPTRCLLPVAVLTVAWCGAHLAAQQGGPPPAHLLGTFDDDYGSRHEIRADRWVHHAGLAYRIVAWHPSEQYLVAQNAADNTTDAGLWTRIDWVRLPGAAPWEWGFCLVAWQAPSRAAAAATAPADRTTPRTGCAGHPFTRMRRVAQAAPPCDAAAHRAFDYWLGQWQVQDTLGRPIARSTITSVSGGCAIAEHWQPLQSAEGRSLSWFDPQDGQWHQQWIGGDGWIARFNGGLEGGEMVLSERPSPGRAGQPVARMRWIRLAPDTVRQVLWQSRDGGATWPLAFVGVYVRRPE